MQKETDFRNIKGDNMTDIEIHGVMKCIETMPRKELLAIEKYTESGLKIVRKELERRTFISISELALAVQGY